MKIAGTAPRLRAVTREVAGIVRIAADLRSLARLVTDVVIHPRTTRLLKSCGVSGGWAWRWTDRERHVRVRGGVDLAYRLNAGDILAMRETWIESSYRLPFPVQPRILLDLGANIGLTSVWLAHTYGSRTVVAVEPLASNVRLLTRNLTRNGITAHIVQAAVGASEGTAVFVPGVNNSTAGRLADDGEITDGGISVPMVTVDRLLELLEDGETVDVLKLDIEGGERALLLGDRGWLSRIRAIVAEFHPWMVDCSDLARLIEHEGFRYIPASTTHVGSIEAFVREPSP